MTTSPEGRTARKAGTDELLCVRLGNTSAIEMPEGLGATEIGEEPEVVRLNGNRVTSVTFPEGVSLGEAFTTITAPGGAWSSHSDKPPAWVETSSGGLDALLAEHFGCEIGAPADLEDAYHTENGPPGVGATAKEGEGGNK